MESNLGSAIPDHEWASITRLTDILRLPCIAGSRPNRSEAALPIPHAPPAARGAAVETVSRDAPAFARQLTPQMPQTAMSGLSEAWRFKEIGDSHWNMISACLGKQSSAIADSSGDRLYATLTRIRVEGAGFLLRTATVRKDVFYVASLRRASDGARLALVRSSKVAIA